MSDLRVLVASEDLSFDALVRANGAHPIHCDSASDTIETLVAEGDRIALAIIGSGRRWDGLREFIHDAFPAIRIIS